MKQDKWKSIVDYVIQHSKILFPVIVIAAAAVTVTVALSSRNSNEEAQTVPGEEISQGSQDMQGTQESAAPSEQVGVGEVLLQENTDQGITDLITTYYGARQAGDTETISALCDEVTNQDLLRFQETSKYIASYPALEIYTKPGLEAGTTLAYVYYRVMFEGRDEEVPGYQTLLINTNDPNGYYIMRGEFSQEVKDYIAAVSEQDDVVVFNNRVTAEYNELMRQRPEAFVFLSELDTCVSTAVGELIAQQNMASAPPEGGEPVQEPPAEGGEPASGEPASGSPEEPAAPTAPATQFAKATTTVNVRNSDSENADKLGKVAGGESIQVLEQRVNGWSKVLYEGQEGYIKSEFLELVESAEGVAAIGTVTATTTVNVRASASETAERLGVLPGGESVELLANENGWCKINYSGQIGYVKADYVQ